ncbi:MAG: transposase [Halioglobus sp.]
MARMPRLVVPGYPHHVMQRGNRRMRTFFCEQDYRVYLKLLAESKAEARVSVWAYCLMPNHVHLIVVPEHRDSLAHLFRQVHRRYSRHINFRENWRGHLWQERFHSCVMDERYLLAAVRYTELNPLRARLCARPQDWQWSSAAAHVAGRDDSVVTVKPMLDRVSDWLRYLSVAVSSDERDGIRRFSTSGRPAGDASFVERIETLTGRALKKRKPGPKPMVR